MLYAADAVMLPHTTALFIFNRRIVRIVYALSPPPRHFSQRLPRHLIFATPLHAAVRYAFD